MTNEPVNNYSNEEIEIDLKALFYVLVEHWVMICVSGVLVGVIALLYSKLLVTPMYTSTSKLYVLSKTNETVSTTDISVGTSLTKDYMEVLVSHPILDKVIENLQISDNYTYAKMSSIVELKNPTNSRIIHITVKDSDPNNAKIIADEIADVAAAYIAEKMDQIPPSIIQYGYADNHAVSPSVKKNTMIGLLIGVILASVIVVVSFLLNDTISTPDDIEEKLGIHVLGSLPLEDKSEYDGEKKRKHLLKKRN